LVHANVNGVFDDSVTDGWNLESSELHIGFVDGKQV
jgi:hypothetical protein